MLIKKLFKLAITFSFALSFIYFSNQSSSQIKITTNNINSHTVKEIKADLILVEEDTDTEDEGAPDSDILS